MNPHPTNTMIKSGRFLGWTRQCRFPTHIAYHLQ